MHALAVQLAPVIAAEKSRVPFYIAAGVLVLWALVLSFVLGLRKPNFPAGRAGERIVIAISVVLVLATAASAVLTSSTPAKSTSSASAGTANAGEASASK
jgi:Mn2+/Fe2+ NRAMP family transporter